MKEEDLIDHIEAGIVSRKDECREHNFRAGSLLDLENYFRDLAKRSEFVRGPSLFRATVLNHLAWMINEEECLRSMSWRLICELARTASNDSGSMLRMSLVVAIFEVAAESDSENEEFIKLHLSLLDDTDLQWAVFSGYARFPDRLWAHLESYAPHKLELSHLAGTRK